MPTANHAVVVGAADQESATIVSLTEDGQIFVGSEPVEKMKLHTLKANPVYVKADARAPFQTVLLLLDALRGKQLVLLTTPAPDVKNSLGVVPPYGLKLVVAGE
jgi:biopolymer transport protein ExbD